MVEITSLVLAIERSENPAPATVDGYFSPNIVSASLGQLAQTVQARWQNHGSYGLWTQQN